VFVGAGKRSRPDHGADDGWGEPVPGADVPGGHRGEPHLLVVRVRGLVRVADHERERLEPQMLLKVALLVELLHSDAP
jgi:hypothetical protein